MSLHTVANLRDSVSGILSGLDLSNVDDLNGCFTRAAATLIQQADVPEASGIQNITLYAGVFDYACDPRIFGTAINDIRPQGITRNANNFVTKLDQEDFDRTKAWYYPSGTRSTFQYQNGQPIIRIVAPFPTQQVIINPMTSTTGWTAAGTASNLMQDSTNYYQTPASLRFNITTGLGTLTNTLQSPLSMSSYEDVGVVFLAIQIPTGATATNLTNIELKLGSDGSNYDALTVTSGFLGSWVSGEWLLVAFDFSGATSTGTPNWASIQYVQVSLTVAGAFTNFRVGGLFMSLPTPAQILYQSAAIFLASGTTAPTVQITNTTDEIILTDPAYNIYLFESANAVLQNTGAGASDATTIKINQILHGFGEQLGLYQIYRGDNPSQEIRTVGSWYDPGQGYDTNSRY
jgi:hypothetical protein